MAIKKIRNMKVYKQGGYQQKPTPTIMLKGQWLREVGLDCGMTISVKCEDGKLIIERDKVREEELAAEKVFMEAETKKLRARLQKKQEELRTRFVAERQAGYGNVYPERRDKE